jgi:hypothetical protein
VPYNWRGFFDFGTGQIGNWATHTAGPVHIALQLTAPSSVEMIRDEGRSKTNFPTRALILLEFPARGEMPPVKVYYHDSQQPGDADAYRVPGMENETILPSQNNLAEKGRQASGRGGGGGRRAATAPAAATAAPAAAPAARPRRGAGGEGVAVFGPPRVPAQKGILSGNGAVFVGTKGILTTCDRGEGVQLLPAARWKDYVLPPQLLTRSPGHMLDWVRACKGGDPSCSDFSITVPFAEWLALAAIAFRVPGKLEWDTKNLRFTNSPEANNYVKPVFKKGWELKL